MWVNQIFSLITEGTVQNIIVCDNYTKANEIARLSYGETAIAVDTTLYPLGIGYKYIDDLFYKEDGTTLVERNLTEAEEIAKINGDNSTLTEYIVDLDYRLSLKELGV